MKKNIVLILIGVILLVISLFSLQYGCNKSREVESVSNQIKALSDTARVYRDKEGLYHIEKTKLEGSRNELLELAKKQDREIARLLKDKKTNSVIQFNSSTKIDTNKNIKFTDSNSCDFNTSISNIWYQANIKLVDTSLKLSLVIKNKYTIVDRQKRDKWYSKKYTVIDIKNHNPYSSSDSLITYTIKPAKKKTTGYIVGGIVLISTLLLLK